LRAFLEQKTRITAGVRKGARDMQMHGHEGQEGVVASALRRAGSSLQTARTLQLRVRGVVRDVRGETRQELPDELVRLSKHAYSTRRG
jgi:hypothetical protein